MYLPNLYTQHSTNYLLLYPFGQTGLTAVTFLTNLPLTHVIVIFLASGAAVTITVGVEEGVGAGVGVVEATNFKAASTKGIFTAGSP